MASKKYEERLAELKALKEEKHSESRLPGKYPDRDVQGRILPGYSTNPAGKPKGTKNKWNKEVKQKLRQVISPYLTQLNEDLAKLEPIDRIKAVVMLLKHCEIRGKGQNGSGHVQNNITFEVTYSDEYKRKKRNTIDLTPDEFKIEDAETDDESDD